MEFISHHRNVKFYFGVDTGLYLRRSWGTLDHKDAESFVYLQGCIYVKGVMKRELSMLTSKARVAFSTSSVYDINAALLCC